MQALQLPALGRRAAGTAYLVYLPTRLWIKPVVSTALPQGDLWISAKFTDSRSAGSTTPSLALVLESMNPQLLLEEIATGAVAASSSGHRVVDHVPFTEYVVSVDLARALAAAARPEPFGPRCSNSSPRSAPVEARAGSLVRIVAGVDGAGRVAQLQASLPGSKLGTVQIGLWKFGSTIPLSLPLTSADGGHRIASRAHTGPPRRPGCSPATTRLDQPGLPDQAGGELAVAERGDAERGVADACERRERHRWARRPGGRGIRSRRFAR